jgi:hypothetical protein
MIAAPARCASTLARVRGASSAAARVWSAWKWVRTISVTSLARAPIDSIAPRMAAAEPGTPVSMSVSPSLDYQR